MLDKCFETSFLPFIIEISESREQEESSGDEGIPEDDKLSLAEFPVEFRETYEGHGEKPKCYKIK